MELSLLIHRKPATVELTLVSDTLFSRRFFIKSLIGLSMCWCECRCFFSLQDSTRAWLCSSRKTLTYYSEFSFRFTLSVALQPHLVVAYLVFLLNPWKHNCGIRFNVRRHTKTLYIYVLIIYETKTWWFITLLLTARWQVNSYIVCTRARMVI